LELGDRNLRGRYLDSWSWRLHNWSWRLHNWGGRLDRRRHQPKRRRKLWGFKGLLLHRDALGPINLGVLYRLDIL